MSTGKKILSDFFPKEHIIFTQFLAASIKYTRRARTIGLFFFFQVVIYCHPGHLQPKILILASVH